MTVALGLTLLVVVLILAAALIVPVALHQRVEWKRTANGYQYHSLEPIAEAVLDRCIVEAFVCLRETDIMPSTLAQLATALRVVVQKVDTWHSPQHGAVIAGLSQGTTIYVGRDLASLCHEMAHACEFIEGGRGKQDDAHETWAWRGFLRAVDRYEVWRANAFRKLGATR